jgi:16S rRNA processing protein RimM
MTGDDEDSVIVGRIVGAHGIQGEVKVKPIGMGRGKSSIRLRARLWVGPDDGEGNWFTVERIRHTGSGSVVKLKDVDDRNRAESFRGCFLKINKEQCRPLPKDTFYVFDLIGLQVYTIDSRYVGTIKEVITNTVQDILIIDSEGKEILIPAVKPFIKKVDLVEHQVILDPIEGMLNGNAD